MHYNAGVSKGDVPIRFIKPEACQEVSRCIIPKCSSIQGRKNLSQESLLLKRVL
ncbi:hypothetical protein HanXRQr2_Chr06g0278471 [Helianthus annuus]|uniref:Uncharacterized protein n=1 Tax=Helianthus annuus TaxID=4232 RepID=A0A9K3IVW6_HELAN|nr:hypothetical protein HanXRQr2_Chr06g0278471 [Helianthus annuus]